MKTLIVKEILFILNNTMDRDNKCSALAELKKRKRGHNRVVIDIVCNMLSSYILPLKHDENIILIKPSLTEREQESLRLIFWRSNFTYFNAVCGEVLWMQKHDVEIARRTLISYVEEISSHTVENEHIYTELIVGCCRLYSRCKLKDFDDEELLKVAIGYVKENYGVTDFGILFVLNALLACYADTKIIEDVFKDAISYYESKNMLDKAISFLEDLEAFYKRGKRKEELKKVRISIAQAQERLADKYDWENPEHSHRIILCIHSAMNAWSRADKKEYNSERKRLAKRIESVKRLSLQTMKVVSGGEVDLSKWIESEKEFVEKSTLESFIQRLAMIIPLKSYEEAKADFREKGSFLWSGFFKRVELDGEGRKKCIIPPALHSSEKDMCVILENEVSGTYARVASVFVNRSLWIAKDKFDFTIENLEFLVNENAFIPENHKMSFLKGLVAGFNLDLITAMHILMPQMEYCIRCLAEECGAVVYKTHEDGVEECLSMTSVLDLPEVVECLDEALLFNLKLFFTSSYGFGMRDEVCHGLYSDSGLQSSNCLATWWFILRICCMYSRNLALRLMEQQST